MIGTLFTADFLERGIRDTAQHRAPDGTAAAARSELARLFAAFPVEASPNEAETEHRPIYPVCDIMGSQARSVAGDSTTDAQEAALVRAAVTRWARAA